jgi:hypothetical protein
MNKQHRGYMRGAHDYLMLVVFSHVGKEKQMTLNLKGLVVTIQQESADPIKIDINT